MTHGRLVRSAGAAALELAVAGCTAPQHDRALPAPSATAPADCTDPRYEFTPAVETETLTYVTPPVTLTAPDGGPLHFSDARPVQPLTATAASSAGDADARRAYDAFVRQSPTPELPGYGSPLEPYRGNPVTGTDRPGRYVGYAFNWVITSSFVRHCAPTAPRSPGAFGTVTTLRPAFPVALVADCAAPRGEVQRRATLLACTPPS
ncbi:hypothetical protein [Kitasatospora sp. NPDC057198]|uniref:hypothetical protein n=1 Tax=Kitasatospora sp. NPDC057198 TaxID=3346046 RepID=UPI00363024A0